MGNKKALRELTLKDNFMFGAVMMDENNCKRLLELILGFPIQKVKVSKEKSIVYHPEYKGVRLDVYAMDDRNTRFNVEMQAVQQSALGKRARYYHSQIDMEVLLSGAEYAELPDTYVIFICDFDPFGEKKYQYTFSYQCKEEPNAKLQDGSRCIFLCTCGENENEVSQSLVKFLKFVKADLTESMQDYEDDFVHSLQKSVQSVKESRELEERFMVLQEMLREEHSKGIMAGKAGSVLELLEELGEVSDTLHTQIMSETQEERLAKWLKLAAKAETMEQFLENM